MTNLRGKERTSVTDTDLIAAGSGAEEPDLRTAVTAETAEISNTQGDVEVQAAQDPAAQGDAALATMVLPELRALATEGGVKGTSGMRKNELIAAIRERRGESISKLRNGGGKKTSDTVDTIGTADTTGTADVGDAPADREAEAPPKDADQPDSGESSDTPLGGDQGQSGAPQGA